MPIYIKQPLEIEAFKLGVDCIPDWFMNKVSTNEIILYGKSSGFEHYNDTNCDIKTLEGTMHANFGDYIIQGIKGEIYPCKADIFEKTYRLKEESEADKMFEDLGYKKLEVEDVVWYQKKSNFIRKDIIFDLEKKIIHIEVSYCDKRGNLLKIEGTLTPQELQAINKKVEELKWMN